MKVLFVSSGKGISGISSFIQAQGESIKAAGVELDYFPIDHHGVKGYLKKAWELKKYLRHHKYDILHAHYGLSALVALLARKNERIVVSFMGDDIVGSNRTDGSLTKSSLWLSRLNTFLAKRFFVHSIVKSEEMLLKLKIQNISMIPNGVDLVRFKPKNKLEARANLGISLKSKIVIFVSDPKRAEKNFPLAKKAVQLLNDLNIKLIPIFNQSHVKLVEYYNAADLIILTSFHEGSPNVIKEAMACNCPIVSTLVGDVKWVLGQTQGCFLTSFFPEDVADKVKLSLEFSEKQGRTEGRERIIELGMDSETIAKRIINVYEKVLH